MVDTLQLAKDLQAGNAFTAEQAERIASAVAKGTEDRRLRDVEQKVTAQTAASAILAALALGVLWQLIVLRGEVSGTAAEMRARFADVDRRFADVDRRFADVDRRLEGIDAKLDQLLSRISPADDPR